MKGFYELLIEHGWHIGDGVDDCSGFDEERMRTSAAEIQKTLGVAPVAPAQAAPAQECARCNQPITYRVECHRCGAVLCGITCEEWHLEKDCIGVEAEAPAQPEPHIFRCDQELCVKNGDCMCWCHAVEAEAPRGDQSNDIPLCANCAETWFCERNHLKVTNNCVVCTWRESVREARGDQPIDILRALARESARIRHSDRHPEFEEALRNANRTLDNHDMQSKTQPNREG